MASTLWRYFSSEHAKEFITSLNLLHGLGHSDTKALATLYALSNNPEKHYRKRSIPKRTGGIRTLLIPDLLLKTVQANILHKVLETLPVSLYATAYRKGGSIVSNASPHVGKNTVLKLDIEDFFSSICYSQVYSLAFPRAYFPPSIAALLTNLCCYNGYLPQGAPTSAYISNLVLKPFDEHMGSWCHKQGIAYTRYCDDLTFSGDFNAKVVIGKVKGFLGVLGFCLNQTKTRLLNRSNRQVVTGVVVNEKAQTHKHYRKNLRKELFYCGKYGASSHMEYLKKKGLMTASINKTQYLQSLVGKINFVLQVNPNDSRWSSQRAWVLSELYKIQS